MTSKYKVASTSLNDSGINGLNSSINGLLNSSNLDDSSIAMVRREEDRPARDLAHRPSRELHIRNSVNGTPSIENADGFRGGDLRNSQLINSKKNK